MSSHFRTVATRLIAGSVAVVTSSALLIAPAMATPGQGHGGGSKKANSGDTSYSDLANRGKNSLINAKRTGQGSVLGASALRSRAAMWSSAKKVRLAIAHSTDGTVAGFKGVTGRTVKASQIPAEIARAEADQTAVSIDIVPEGPRLMDSVSTHPGGGEHPQWALTKLQAEELWAKTKGAGVTVAVLDTGIQGDHPDLEGKLLSGKDYVNPDNTESVDPNGHGTHVAGIIAASMNDFGVTGLAPEVDILPIRVIDQGGDGDWLQIIDAITYAADEGADVINMSFGAEFSDWEPLTLAVAHARLMGASLVASSGNNSQTKMMIPARTPGVLGVGGTTENDTHVPESNYNSSVDLSAPGDDIYSTYKDSSYLSQPGTSMAAAFASATVALTLAAARQTNAESTAVGVEQVVLDTAVDLGESGPDHEFGVGRVAPLAAVESLLPAGSTEDPTEDPAEELTEEPADSSMSTPADSPKIGPVVVTQPAKATRSRLNVTAKVKRARSKSRRVTLRSNSTTAVKITLVKKVRGKWRVQRTVFLPRGRQVTLWVGVGMYRLQRPATAVHFRLNKLVRLR